MWISNCLSIICWKDCPFLIELLQHICWKSDHKRNAFILDSTFSYTPFVLVTWHYPTFLIVVRSETGSCWFFILLIVMTFLLRSLVVYHQYIIFYIFNIIILVALKFLSANYRISGMISMTSFPHKFESHFLFLHIN